MIYTKYTLYTFILKEVYLYMHSHNTRISSQIASVAKKKTRRAIHTIIVRNIYVHNVLSRSERMDYAKFI